MVPTWLPLVRLAWLSLVWLAILVTAYSAENTCSMEPVPVLQRSRRISVGILKSLTTSGPMSCARVCLLWTLCESFSFQSATGLCELSSQAGNASNVMYQHGFVASDISDWPSTLARTCANLSCPKNAVCDPRPLPTCAAVCCLSSNIPVLDNAVLTTVVSDEICPLGTILNYTCDSEFFPLAQSICKVDGSWTFTPRRLAVPTTCLEVQHCLPSSTDGEYWITLPNFDFYRTKVYCHGMDSSEPTSFLTLARPNHGVYPSVSNFRCTAKDRYDGPISCPSKDGLASYKKIKIDLEQMTVIRSDYSFAEFSNAHLPYGQAFDCFTPHPDNVLSTCGTKGTFTIDLSGTGWIVRLNQTWVTAGWKPVIESIKRTSGGSVVNLRCGGFPGGCNPSGNITLTPHPVDSPQESAAVGIRCNDKTYQE